MKKRIFIGLLLTSLLVLLGIFFFAWWMVSKNNLLINQVMLTIITGFIIIIFLLIFLGIGFLTYSIWKAKSIPSMHNLMRLAINLLFPIAVKIGGWFGLTKDEIKNSFIQVSNQLVKTKKYHINPQDILILAPHCLQKVECPYKISIDVTNCRECGKCVISDLQKVSKATGVKLVVATGGTFARKFILEQRPKGIVAIACERDLTSGIQDVHQIPVLGVVNERPNGPCCNTDVNTKKVIEAINYFTQGGE